MEVSLRSGEGNEWMWSRMEKAAVAFTTEDGVLYISFKYYGTQYNTRNIIWSRICLCYYRKEMLTMWKFKRQKRRAVGGDEQGAVNEEEWLKMRKREERTSFKSGTGKGWNDHYRARNITCQLSFVDWCISFKQHLRWVTLNLRNGRWTTSKGWWSCLVLDYTYLSSRRCCLNVQYRLRAKMVSGARGKQSS